MRATPPPEIIEEGEQVLTITQAETVEYVVDMLRELALLVRADHLRALHSAILTAQAVGEERHLHLTAQARRGGLS